MRKLVFLAVVVMVLAVGSLQVRADEEPASGGTVPDGGHAVFLPVVEKPDVCPYEVQSIRYANRLPEDHPMPDAHYFTIYNRAIEESDDAIAGEMIVAKDSGFGEPVAHRMMEQVSVAPGNSLAVLPQESLTIGQTYFWKARFTCEGKVPGPWTSVQEFVATTWETD